MFSFVRPILRVPFLIQRRNHRVAEVGHFVQRSRSSSLNVRGGYRRLGAPHGRGRCWGIGPLLHLAGRMRTRQYDFGASVRDAIPGSPSSLPGNYPECGAYIFLTVSGASLSLLASSLDKALYAPRLQGWTFLLDIGAFARLKSSLFLEELPPGSRPVFKLLGPWLSFGQP